MTDVPNGNNKWRLSKDIPLPLVAAFVLQTLLFTWFLAIQSKSLTDVIKAVSEGQATAYKKDDAAREREFQEEKQRRMTDRTDELIRRITIIEGQGQASARAPR